MSPLKQVLVLKEDLGLSKGKMISQACHASLKAYEDAEDEKIEDWKSSGAKKVALDAGERDLEQIHAEARRTGLAAALVKDAGRTELDPGTVTAVGIGPDDESKIDTVTGQFKLIE